MQWDFRKIEWKIMCMFSKYVEILKLQSVLDLLCCIITLQICCKFWCPGRHQEIPLEQSGSFSLYFLKIHRYKKLKVHSVTNIPNSRNRLEYPVISVSFFFLLVETYFYVCMIFWFIGSFSVCKNNSAKYMYFCLQLTDLAWYQRHYDPSLFGRQA